MWVAETQLLELPPTACQEHISRMLASETGPRQSDGAVSPFIFTLGLLSLSSQDAELSSSLSEQAGAELPPQCLLSAQHPS